MVIRVEDAELMTSTEVDEALAIHEFFCDRFGGESFFIGQLAVDPVSLGREKLLQFGLLNVGCRTELQAAVALDGQFRSSAASMGQDRNEHAVELQCHRTHVDHRLLESIKD